MDRRAENPSRALIFVGKYTDPQYRLMDTMTCVFEPRLAADFKALFGDSPVDKATRQKYFRGRQEIYLDAVIRGQNLVWERLNNGELRIGVLGGLAQRVYTSGSNQLTWRLEPMTSDPFEAGAFFKEVKGRGLDTQGIIAAEKDPYLVDEMVRVGLEKQRKLFARFLAVHKAIQQVEQSILGFTPWLTRPQESFAPIKNLFLDLQQRQERPEGMQDFFVAKIAKEDQVTEADLAKAEKQVRQTISLDQLFLRKKIVETRVGVGNGYMTDSHAEYVPVETINKPLYEKSLLVLLLAGNEVLSETDLRMPEVDREQVMALNEFLKKAQSELPKQDYLQLQALLVYRTMETRKANLSGLFEKMDIHPELGLEYIHYLMLAYLKTMPDSFFYETEQGTPQRTDALVKLNALYRLNNPIQVKEYRPDYLQLFIDRLFKNKIFGREEYGRIIDNERISALETIFNRLRQLTNDGEYDLILTRIFQGFYIEYSTQNHRFYRATPYTHSVERKLQERWQAISQDKIYQLMLNQIEAGDQRMITFLEKRVFRQEVLSYLKESGTVASDRQLMRQAGNLNSKVNNEFSKEKIPLDEALAQLSKWVSQVALRDCYKTEDMSNAGIRAKIGLLTTLVIRWLGANNRILTNPKIEAEFIETAAAQAKGIISDVTQNCFGPGYSQNRAKVIVEIISRLRGRID